MMLGNDTGYLSIYDKIKRENKLLYGGSKLRSNKGKSMVVARFKGKKYKMKGDEYFGKVVEVDGRYEEMVEKDDGMRQKQYPYSLLKKVCVRDESRRFGGGEDFMKTVLP